MSSAASDVYKRQGNEGNGVSDTVKKLCDKSLFIPISSAESLNASVAASVIAWEMSKVRD